LQFETNYTMSLAFTLVSLGIFGPDDISNLPFKCKQERILEQKNAANELVDNARKNLTGCQIASDSQKDEVIVVRADHTRFCDSAGIEVIVTNLIVADYPADRIELAGIVVWIDVKQMPLKVSRVTSNNLMGVTAKLDGDKLTVFKKNGDVCCTATLASYLENVRTLLVTN